MSPVPSLFGCEQRQDEGLISTVADQLVRTSTHDINNVTTSVPRSVLRYGVAQDRGTRCHMEDAYVAVTNMLTCTANLPEVHSNCALFGVFDGHGGTSASKFASDNFAKLLFAQQSFPTNMTAALRAAFLQLEADYYAACKTYPAGRDAGSTALAAVLCGDQLFVANAGDCRAVLCQRGKAVVLTTDHRPTLPSEHQRIQACGGWVSPDGYLNGKLGVARSIGDYHIESYLTESHEPQHVSWAEALVTAEPETCEHRLTPDDEFLILGSDGLWDSLTSEWAVEYARKSLIRHNDPVLCAQELVREATNSRKSLGDNISVVTVCFSDSPPPKRNFSSSRLRPSRA